MRPLFALDFNKGAYKSSADKALFENLDTYYLCLNLLDFLMEGASVSSGRTSAEIAAYLSELIATLDSSLISSDCKKAAEIVAAALDNRANNFKSFESTFFDAQSKQQAVFKFQLVGFGLDLEDEYRFQPTPFGYLVYLGMLDLAPEDAAEFMEKMLQILIQRGKFDEALDIAKRARTLTIEYRQSIRDNLSRAQRSPAQVNWNRDLAPKLDNARDHIQSRQSQDQLMMQSVRDSLLQTKQIDSRRNMVSLLSTIENASLLRGKLLTDISGAYHLYNTSKVAMFRVRTNSNLPDLESKLLPDLMQLKCSYLAEEGDEIISSLYPCSIPNIYDISLVLKLLSEKRVQPQDYDETEGELVETETWQPQYSEEAIKSAELWIRNKLLAESSISVSALMNLAESEYLHIEQQQLIALLLFRSFSFEETLFPEHEAYLNGTKFRTKAASGDSFEMRNTRLEQLQRPNADDAESTELQITSGEEFDFSGVRL